MAFAEDLSVFADVAGFAVAATLVAASVTIIFDAPGTDVLDGALATTEPSALIKASDTPAAGEALVLAALDLPAQLAHLAGSYAIRSLMPEPPDGAFVRCFLVKTA